ncbi:MAG: hypothetical protein AAGG51_04450 [Cyanobacteria bacterium P01_G01_bin.54]
MLQRIRFMGSITTLLQQAGAFWVDFKHSIEDVVYDTDGNLDQIEKERSIRFYDSSDQRLRNNNYVFRERVNLRTREREVTLKYRHPDRYISQDRDMSAAKRKKGKTKFEEDIKLPFLKLYSFSTKQPISERKKLNTLADPGKLYPDLSTRLPGYQADEPLQIVNNFTARELVITGAMLKIGKRPKVRASCALVVWYDAADSAEAPIVVEFSFKYENEQEDYAGAVAQRAYEVLRRLGDALPDWVDTAGPTKTAYVYTKA